MGIIYMETAYVHMRYAGLIYVLLADILGKIFSHIDHIYIFSNLDHVFYGVWLTHGYFLRKNHTERT